MAANNDDPEQIQKNTNIQSELGFGAGVSGSQCIVQHYTRDQANETVSTVTFSRTYLHFLGDGNDGDGAAVETDNDGFLCYTYDFGGSIIPYNICKAAVTPYHLWPYFQKCNSYRILGHSAKLHDMICSRDEVQADGRVVTSTQTDTIEIIKDENGMFWPENIMPCGSQELFLQNRGFNIVEPKTWDEGLMCRAKIKFPPEMFQATADEVQANFLDGAFDVYNGMLKIEPWSGGDYTISHNFDSGRIPVGAFSMKNQSNITPNHMNCGNYLIDTVWGIQANMATQVNTFPILPPKFALMRFAPYYLASGKATRRAQFKCTYTTTIEFYNSPNACINMFMLGDQAKRLAFPFKDPMQQASADISRFNFGVRPHQFIIPHTSFSFGIWKDQSDYPYRYEDIPKQTSGTMYEKVGEILTAANYNVGKTTHATQTDVEDATTDRTGYNN